MEVWLEDIFAKAEQEYEIETRRRQQELIRERKIRSHGREVWTALERDVARMVQEFNSRYGKTDALFISTTDGGAVADEKSTIKVQRMTRPRAELVLWFDRVTGTLGCQSSVNGQPLAGKGELIFTCVDTGEPYLAEKSAEMKAVPKEELTPRLLAEFFTQVLRCLKREL